MTHEEWLNAMSAPRIIPGDSNPRHMSMPGHNDDPTDSEDSEEGTEEDDEEGVEWETDRGTDDEEGAHSGDEEKSKTVS